MVKIIEIKRKKLSLKRSYNNPNFTGKSVLVTDTWDYVELWLKRKNNTEAQFYWRQAKHFYEATLQLNIFKDKKDIIQVFMQIYEQALQVLI